jgi:hypothetical protein
MTIMAVTEVGWMLRSNTLWCVEKHKNYEAKNIKNNQRLLVLLRKIMD